MHHQSKLFEGLRSKDLKGFVSEIFTVDQYKSKMGEDKDVVVIGFKVNDKYPATDLMEFIEKGYPYVLDADISSGEERDGHYQVFVEFERNKKFPQQLKNLLSGVSQLTDNWEWRFRYYKDFESHTFTEDSVTKNVPLTKEDYERKMLEIKNKSVSEFFDQGTTDIVIDENNTMLVSKPYSGDISMDLLAMGEYETIKESLQGPIQLDEASQSQVAYLNKYLGNYEIHKIDNKFLIKNGDRGAVVKKDRW